MNPHSSSIDPILGINSSSYSLVSMPETPVIPADVIELNPPPSIERLEVEGDEDTQKLEEIMIKWDEYKDKHTKFLEQRKSLLSTSVVVPPIEEYRKLHAEICQLYEEIKALEASLAKDKAKEFRSLSVANRVNSLSSSVMSSSTSSTSQSSGTSAQELLSSARVSQHEGDTSTTIEATIAHDWSNTDSSFSSVNSPNKSLELGDSKESKFASEESPTSYSRYARIVSFEDEGPTVFSSIDAAQIGLTTYDEYIKTCREYIMSESDLNQYSQEVQIELRKINEEIETLKAVFEAMLEDGDATHIQFQQQLEELIFKQRDLRARVVAKKLGVGASPKKEKASSSSLSSQASVTEGQRRIQILEQVLARVSALGELDEGQFKDQAREYNQQRRAFFKILEEVIKDVTMLTPENMLMFENSVDAWQRLKRRIESMEKLSAPVLASSHLASTSSSSSVVIAPLSQFDKEKYLKVLHQLQTKISLESGEMSPSFFKDEHHARVKKYNADQLKLIEDLKSARSKVNELLDDRISIRIKNMESRARELKLENLRLYHLLLS